MKWIQHFSLNGGEQKVIEGKNVELHLSFDDSSVFYRRDPLPDTDEDSPVEKTFIIEDLTQSASFSFLPVYPDRPLVFKLNDELSIPPGQNGFFCLTMEIGVGVEVLKTDTLIEHVRSSPYKNTYWGSPQNGIFCYQVQSSISTDPRSLMYGTDRSTAVLPVYYRNKREEGDLVIRCLVPLSELDLYQNPEGDLIFEVVRLTQSEEYYQEPEPRKRPPREMKTDLELFLSAPEKPQSLYETVKSLPRLDQLTKVLINR